MTQNNDAENNEVERGNPGRRQLVAILLIALVSLGGSYSLFYATSEGGVWGTTNHGEFVTPEMTVEGVGVTQVATGERPQGDSWWLWIVVDECEEGCEAALHQLRQLHVLLNKEASRVRRGLVIPGGSRVPAGVTERYPRLQLLQLPEAASLSQGIYIVDPLGNLVLTYPLADAGKPVLEDLKRLLKLSQIG